MGVEKIVRFISPTQLGKPDDVDQHFGQGVAGHREIEKESAVGGKDGDPAQLALLFERAQSADLFETRPVLVFQHHAGWIVRDDASEHVRRHDEDHWIVLDHEGNVGPFGLDGPAHNNRRSGRRCAPKRAARSRRRPRLCSSPRERASVAAKPGAETPTMKGSFGARAIQRDANTIASSWSSFGASPMMPRMVTPSAPNGDVMIDHPIRAGVVDLTIRLKRRRRDRKNSAGIDVSMRSAPCQLRFFAVCRTRADFASPTSLQFGP
jgi:hypothetical protein